ncbi:MAG: hypothetical protein RDV48_04575 [Candidatus Eremiobacteraeota bacterium]|nr:hypothetical protein [Candidatus Eremiobacteraeota bacterium]
MPQCPVCNHRFITASQQSAQKKQRSRASRFAQKILELLSLDVPAEDLQEALDALQEEGFIVKKRQIS